MARWDGPPLEAWKAWTPAEVAERLDGVDITWCVVGGWAIDLTLGEVTREHEDLEIAILHDDLPAIRDALDGFDFYVVGDGEVCTLGRNESPPEHIHQTWVTDPVANEWRVDVMREPGDVDTWICRRDESIRAPRSAMVASTPDGIPHVRAHGQLVYKAKAARPKDEHDLEVTLPHLTDDERAWLHDAIALVHPGHAWLARLT